MGKIKRKYQKTGLYAVIRASELDGRTTTAKRIRELQRELTDYAGGKPSVPVQIIINKIIYVTIRLNNYENAMINNPDTNELPHYTPLSNSLIKWIEVLMKMTEEERAEAKVRKSNEISAFLSSKSIDERKEMLRVIREKAIDSPIDEKYRKLFVDSRR